MFYRFIYVLVMHLKVTSGKQTKILGEALQQILIGRPGDVSEKVLKASMSKAEVLVTKNQYRSLAVHANVFRTLFNRVVDEISKRELYPTFYSPQSCKHLSILGLSIITNVMHAVYSIKQHPSQSVLNNPPIQTSELGFLGFALVSMLGVILNLKPWVTTACLDKAYDSLLKDDVVVLGMADALFQEIKTPPRLNRCSRLFSIFCPQSASDVREDTQQLDNIAPR